MRKLKDYLKLTQATQHNLTSKMESAMEFREEIKKHLKGLTPRQKCQFIWLCGVRALPFLCVGGMVDDADVEFWSSKQGLLYCIFYTLDSCVKFTFRDLSNNISPFAIDAADVVNSAAFLIYTDYKYTAYAMYSVAHTAFCTYAPIGAAAAEASRGFDSSSPATCLADADPYNIYDIKNILLNDISLIHSNRFNKIELCSNDNYGRLWKEFQSVLNEIGCGYWANIYINLFSNGLKIDWDALECRMKAPESIREFGIADEIGAADVAAYLSNSQSFFIQGDKGVFKPLEAAIAPSKSQDKPSFLETINRTEVFISYTHKDKKYLSELNLFLESLKRDHSITIWVRHSDLVAVYS